MVLIVASSAVSLATPFLVRAVIDDAIPHQNVSLLLWAVGGMLAVTVISSLFGVVQTWISTTVGQRIMHGLRTRVFSHLQRQSLSFFTRTRGGEIQSRLTNDIGGMQSVVTTTATSLAANITTVVGTAIAMAVLSWRLSLLSLIVLPPAIWLTRRVAQMRRAITTRQQRRLADIQTQIDEGLSVSGVLLGKTLGTGPALADKFAKTSADLADLEVQAQLSGRWRMATMNIVFAAIPAVRRISHLPVLVDPSHGTGKNFMVTPLARAGVAVGADGLIVEVHDQPEHALSDGAQALTLDQYDQLVTEVRSIHEVIAPVSV